MKQFCDISDEYIESKHKKIASNIKNIRIKKGITQEYVALSMGFTTATFYTNAENFKNAKHFNLEHLIKIAAIFDVDICDFFDNSI
jgi:transcriptional regulator with XRE-family HTH domain